MKSFYHLIALLFCINISVCAQLPPAKIEEDPIKRLDEKNGFQGIVLGSGVNEYQDFVLLKSCSDLRAKELGKGFDYVFLGDAHDSIVGVKINYVFLRTNDDNEIAEIGVHCDYNFDLTQATKKVFGDPTYKMGEKWDYEEGKAIYGVFIWESDNVRLHYSYKRYKSKLDDMNSPYPSYIMMKYLSLTLERKENFEKMQKEKDKFEGVTDDF